MKDSLVAKQRSWKNYMQNKDKRCILETHDCEDCNYFYENENSKGQPVCNIWNSIPEEDS